MQSNYQLHQKETVTKPFYFLSAMILEIENKDEPWYDTCNQCQSRVFNTGQGVECKKCKKSNVEHTPRYTVKLIVSDGDQSARITLCDAAEEFIESKTQNNMHCRFYRKLILCGGRYYKFLIRMRKISDDDRSSGRFVAQEVEKTEDPETSKEQTRKKAKK